MRKHSSLFFSVLGLGIAASLCGGPAEASVRIDHPWVQVKAHEICVPQNAMSSSSCLSQVKDCEAAFARMTYQNLFTFCEGQYPGLCNKVGNRVGEEVYEFSDDATAAYVMLVEKPAELFFLKDPLVKAAQECLQKTPVVAVPLDSLPLNSSAAPLLEGKTFVPKAPDYEDRMPPGYYVDRLPPVDVAPAPVVENPPAPVEAAPVAEVPKPGNVVQPQAPSPQEKPEPIAVPKAQDPGQEGEEAAVVGTTVENPPASSSGATPSLTGWSCSLHPKTASPWPMGIPGGWRLLQETVPQ